MFKNGAFGRLSCSSVERDWEVRTPLPALQKLQSGNLHLFGAVDVV